MEACTKFLEDPDGGDPDNVVEDIKIEDREQELDPERAQKTESPTQGLGTLLKVQDMIAAEI